MTYQDAIRFLFRLESFGIKLGLDNIRLFVERLGHPECAFPAIHVAGTNGKGTVCSAIAAVLTSTGCRTGLFTSPHLVDFRERIRVDGARIPKTEVARFVERHHSFIRANRITFFETATALAFDWFARSHCAAAVVEVGMGGRLDATNIITPALAVITGIDLDHMNLLGNTRPRIAREKAGIIKPGVAVVCGPLADSARRVIGEIAGERHADMIDTSRTVALRAGRSGEFAVSAPEPFPRRVRWRYPGLVQVDNLKTVIGAVTQLRSAGWRITDRDIRRGLAAARWPGRFQIQPGRPMVIYDVAHNPAAARGLAQTLAEVTARRYVAAVFAVAEDKDWPGIIRCMMPRIDRWYFTRLSNSRSWRLTDVRDLARRRALSFTASRSAKRMLQLARVETPSDGIVVVFGSHYLVGELIPPSSIDPAPLDLSSRGSS